ncbi:MAG: hypothetical protein J6T68_02550 [Candidatus Methanomethylophilaceae archaeon]|nr:hypothetical protein [Candidatus Methanomethylophilaceae archaeon]
MRSFIVVLAVSAVILAAGAATAYAFNPQVGFTASVNGDGDVIVDVNGAWPAELTYRVMENAERPDRICIFLDEEYPGMQSYRAQKKSLTTFEEMMSRRGYDSIEFVELPGLKQILTDTSAAPGTGLMMTGGALPDDVTQDMVRTWMESGGTLYWSGPDIGRFVDDGEEVKDTGTGMFGASVNYTEDDPYLVTEASDIALEMGFAGSRARYGLVSDYPGSKVLGLYDDYSSLSVLSMGAGRLYLFGTNFDEYDVEKAAAIADIVAAGITENTVITDRGELHKGYWDQSFDIGNTNPGSSVYITSGSPVSAKGRCFFL